MQCLLRTYSLRICQGLLEIHLSALFSSIYVVRWLRPWPNLTAYRSPECALDLSSPLPLKGESSCEGRCGNLRDTPFLDGIHSFVLFLHRDAGPFLFFSSWIAVSGIVVSFQLSLRRAALSTDYTGDFCGS
jgi:hypothetical protein